MSFSLALNNSKIEFAPVSVQFDYKRENAFSSFEQKMERLVSDLSEKYFSNYVKRGFEVRVDELFQNFSKKKISKEELKNTISDSFWVINNFLSCKKTKALFDKVFQVKGSNKFSIFLAADKPEDFKLADSGALHLSAKLSKENLFESYSKLALLLIKARKDLDKEGPHYKLILKGLKGKVSFFKWAKETALIDFKNVEEATQTLLDCKLPGVKKEETQAGERELAGFRSLSAARKMVVLMLNPSHQPRIDDWNKSFKDPYCKRKKITDVYKASCTGDHNSKTWLKAVLTKEVYTKELLNELRELLKS